MKVYEPVWQSPDGTMIAVDYVQRGQRFAGPTLTKAQWAAIRKAQRKAAAAAKAYSTAASKATDAWKCSKYMAVNGIAFKWGASARTWADRVEVWSPREEAAAAALRAAEDAVEAAQQAAVTGVRA